MYGEHYRCTFCARPRLPWLWKADLAKRVRERRRRHAAREFPADPIDCPFCATHLEDQHKNLVCPQCGPVLTVEDL